MTDMMQGLLADARNGRFSSIRDTLSDEDISSVWENAASYIEKQMALQKGVNIPNLGTFTFSQKKLDVGNNKYILIQRPVFNISEKFAQTHALHFTKYHVPGQIPVVQMNYAALSFESPFDRDTVESCIREILSSINRSVASRKNVEVLFAGIGRLSIRDSRVKMKFFKDFINQMDGSGKLVDSLQNRPGTVDSVMSDRNVMSRPSTGNTLILPKISSSQVSGGNNSLPTVAEQEENYLAVEDNNTIISDVPLENHSDIYDGIDVQPTVQPADRLEDIVGADTGDFQTDHAIANILNTTEVCPVDGITDYPREIGVGATDLVVEDEPTIQAPLFTRVGSRLAMPLPQATGVSLLDDLVPSSLTPQLVRGTPTFSGSQSPLIPGTPLINKSYTGPQIHGEGERYSPFAPRTSLHNKFLSPPHLAPLSRARSAEQAPTEIKDVTFAENVKPSSACGHPNAGQELCYLCHQRYSRNIPVSFTNEKNKREEEEDLMLRQFQSLKDGEDMLREQERTIYRRNDLQKIAAFNLGVSEAVHAKKKTKDNEFHRSYVFQKRALTPHRFPKQDAYSRDLEKQVDIKDKSKQEEKSDNDFLERLEQVQLAEDLAAQREQYLRNKMEQQDSYKKALETQLKYKPVPIVPREPDSEVFGLHDITNEKLLDKRRRAHDLFRDQLDTVAQRKRDAILRRLAEQEEEEQVLAKTKEELIEDRANRFGRKYGIRKELEADWQTATQSKRAKDLQQKLSSLRPGMLVHEQCDKYKRCHKCCKKVENCGESNLWSESRYIPGSRLIV